MNRNYKPGEMLDAVKSELGIFTDKSLCEILGVTGNQVTLIRTHRAPLTADWLLRIHTVTGWGVDYIRGLAGDESEDFFKRPVGGKFKWKWEP